MAGLTKRFCSQACPYKDDTDIKGQCGSCSSKSYPCDAEGNNCGEWQRADCALNACGDGHDCPRYIDIEFTLDAFVIQGKVCTNASGVSLTQQCGGGAASTIGGDFNNTPVSGTPTGWGAASNGTQDFVTYEKTEHKLRLTRQDCGCFWGGYWSSSCDCNTCCCTNAGGGSCDASDVYPNCDDCTYDDCLSLGVCVDDSGDSCRPCDPTKPCYSTDNGYASSLDNHGTGNIGTSDGQALCVAQSARSDAAGNACGYRTTTCDSWIDAGTGAYAGWETGTFKPHHIEAYFTYQVGTSEDCNSGWVLEIRGLTELSRSAMGLAGGYPSLDCSGSDACSKSSGGTGSPALGYRGRWWGLSSVCNLQNHCTDDPPASGDQPAIPELVFHSCGCPPTTEIDSTVRVDNAMNAFHPAGVYAANAGGATTGAMNTCVVNDAQGNNEPAEYCNNDSWIATQAPPCLGRTYLGGGNYSEGTCYGSPNVWWDKCEYCANCDNLPTNCNGCVGNPITNCGAKNCNCCSGECDCNYPTVVLPTAIPDPVGACSHCAGGVVSLNHATCNPCPADGSSESKLCVPCNIKISPNDLPNPSWRGV